MRKNELIEAVIAKTCENKKEATLTINTMLEVISEEVAKGNSVTINGFGTFKPFVMSARKGINPKTGEKINIPEIKSMKLKASRLLKKSMNS